MLHFSPDQLALLQGLGATYRPTCVPAPTGHSHRPFALSTWLLPCAGGGTGWQVGCAQFWRQAVACCAAAVWQSGHAYPGAARKHIPQ